jgi:hypothetical protein
MRRQRHARRPRRHPWRGGRRPLHLVWRNRRLVRPCRRFRVRAGATSTSIARASLSSPTGRTAKVRARLARARPARSPRANHLHARACVAFGILTIVVPSVLIRRHQRHQGRRGEGHHGRQDDGPDGLLQAREAHDLEDKRAHRFRARARGHG